MIDFHSHILPNIDDGPTSIEETFKLLHEAENAGFNKIISTSHYMEGYYEVKSGEREVWVNGLNKKLEFMNSNIRVYLGNEIYITDNIINLLEQGNASTINNTNYVLFETAFDVKPINLYGVIFEMQRYRLVPILAHPERYFYMQNEPEIIDDLIEKGVMMQSNFGSIVGLYGRKAQVIMKKMLKKNKVHFLGSDIHRADTIYPKMPKIIKELKRIVGEDKLYEITTINPELVLNNKKIEI